MSASCADLRFALPMPARRACVLGGLEEWRRGLLEAGVQVDGGGRPDLAVAPSKLIREAIATGAAMIVVDGRRFAPLSRAGLTVRRYLALPSVQVPELVLPFGATGPANYALAKWRPAYGSLKRTRNRLTGALISADALPPLRTPAVIGQRGSQPPFLVAAAAAAGVPPEASWFMTVGQGDALTRSVFHLFEPGSPEPSWALKFARVPGYREPFDRDERGLRLAARAGPIVAARAPRLLGRLEVEGLHASVETAADGEPLSSLVRRAPNEARAKIDKVAAWISEIGGATATPPEALASERVRLARDVVPRWSDCGAPSDLVDLLPPVRGVLQHNDLGTWNVVVGRNGFTVVDWESARSTGLPLWDLLYFLVDAFPQVAGARTADQRLESALQLLRGGSPHSPALFDWIRHAGAVTGVPPESVGLLATLCFLHHGLSHVARSGALARAGTGDVLVPPIERIAPIWLKDGALGLRWAAWQAAR